MENLRISRRELCSPIGKQRRPLTKVNADESRSEWGITRLLKTEDEKLEATNRWISFGKKAKVEKDGEGLPAST